MIYPTFYIQALQLSLYKQAGEMRVLLCFKFMLPQITYCLLSLQGVRRRQGEVVLTVPEGAPGAVHCWGAGVEAAWSTPDLSDSSPPWAVLSRSVVSDSLQPRGL